MLHKNLLAILLTVTFAGAAMAQTATMAPKPASSAAHTNATKHTGTAKVHHVSHKTTKPAVKKTTTPS
jgi:hypothetical protein